MNLKNVLIVAFIGLFAAACSQNANIGKNVKLKTQLDSASYALGADVANHLKNNNGVNELNYQAFMNGVQDALNENDKKLDENQIRTTIQTFLSESKKKRDQRMLEKGQEFLEKNKKKEGVKVTESGLQYKVIEEGTGISPDANDTVKVNYVGKHIDGTIFDSTEKQGKPIEFGLNRVIPGWTEGLQLMKEGAKYKFFIPSELAYGKRVRPGGPIKPNEALIFEVELLEVKKAENTEE